MSFKNGGGGGEGRGEEEEVVCHTLLNSAPHLTV